MKYIILFFFFQLFFVQANYAQQIYPMFVSDNNDKVWDVLELDDLKFVITKNKTIIKNTKNIKMETLPNTPTSAIALNTFLYIFFLRY